MAQYNVSATVTSAPTDVSLKVDNARINMARDASQEWAGKAKLDLPDSVPIVFRATGIAFAPWTLEIKFTTLPPDSKVVKDYKHEDTIPSDLLTIFNDTVNLKGTAAP
jgi:hypothetical protein